MEKHDYDFESFVDEVRKEADRRTIADIFRYLNLLEGVRKDFEKYQTPDI